MPETTTTCPCGHVLPVPFVNGEYEPLGIHCPKCKRHSTWGNTRTGEVYKDGWITAKDSARAEAVYEAQLFDADNNELYGRGNW